MPTIENTIQIAAAPSRILEALTTKEGMQGWWTTAVECNPEQRQATFRFARKSSDPMAVTFQLVSADDHGVVMKCIRDSNNPDWLGTTLAFTLAPGEGGKTRVDLSHAGYPAKNELYDQCVKGWAFFLGSLQKYIETGTGEPFQNS
jgi:uncharacterized protein YndB with AHSA1/START domain